MTRKRQRNYLISWTEGLLARGKNTFSWKQLREEFEDIDQPALISALRRLVQKRKAVSVYRGFYVILRPENYIKGIVSPILFIDPLMEYLERSYYVSLLSAALLHGSSHQYPQEFFVTTGLPQLHQTIKKGVKINYISRIDVPDRFLISRKVETGYIKVSSLELTAIDLIRYQNHIGGLSRAATLINDLSESMEAQYFSDDLISETPVTFLQRLGYILENYSLNPKLGNKLLENIRRIHGPLIRMPLKPGKRVGGFKTDKKWHLIINTKIEIDQ